MPDPITVSRPSTLPSAPAFTLSGRELTPLEDYIDKISRNELSDLRNCCGPYAVTAVRRAYGLDAGIEATVKEVNPGRIFTGPNEMMRALERSDLSVSPVNRSNPLELGRHLERGNAAVLLVQCEGQPHWIVVGGCRRTETGEVRWRISDAANMSGSTTAVGEISHTALMEAWGKPFGRLSGLSGFHNYGILVAPSGELERRASLRTLHVDTTADLINATVKTGSRAVDGVREIKAQTIDRLATKKTDTR